MHAFSNVSSNLITPAFRFPACNARAATYFYEARRPGENTPKLYARAGRAGAPERLLVDPDEAAAGQNGKHCTIDYFLPSLDGKYVGYGISEGGSEIPVIHVVQDENGPFVAGCDRSREIRRA